MEQKAQPNIRSFTETPLVEYLAIPPRDKKCSCACSHCFLLHSPTMKNAVKRTEQRMIDDINSLSKQGYKLFFCTTELFYYERWKEIFSIAGYKSVRSNGYPLVENPELIDEIKKLGVKKVTFTANAGKYHEGLKLPREEIINRAIDLVRTNDLSASVNVLLTKRNHHFLEEMIYPFIDRGVSYFIFSRILPTEGMTGLMSTEDTRRVYEQVEELKKKFPFNKTGIYFEVSGEMGSTYRLNREKTDFYCPAGTRLLAIGLDDGVYPCSFMTQKRNRLGSLIDGKINLDKKFDLRLNNSLECLAYENQ